MLHTPLMSGTNAIHGIVLVGAILVAGRAGADTLTLVDRLLRRRARHRQRRRRLRRHRPDARDVQAAPAGEAEARMSRSTTDLLYLVTIVTFILALRFLSSPKRARQGNLLGAAGMALAIAVTLLQKGLENFVWIGLAMAIGAVIGVVGARSVKMTAMPQMVALFNGVGGGAVALIALAEFHNLIAAAGRAAGRGVDHDPALGADRQHLLLRLADRVREAAGAAERASDRLSGPAVRERRRAADRARPRRPDRRRSREGSRRRRADRGRARLRRSLRAADRRRRHARRDLAAERFHGALPPRPPAFSSTTTCSSSPARSSAPRARC